MGQIHNFLAFDCVKIISNFILNHQSNHKQKLYLILIRFFGKSLTLLTILFGYSFAILINNVAAKGKNPVAFFSWRMILLFLLMNLEFFILSILHQPLTPLAKSRNFIPFYNVFLFYIFSNLFLSSVAATNSGDFAERLKLKNFYRVENFKQKKYRSVN